MHTISNIDTVVFAAIDAKLNGLLSSGTGHYIMADVIAILLAGRK
ncbi:MAG TPA: hypothetical protein VFQ97_02315 [Gallionella sp.]|nr:hypothetical protein [Gallionella sp.]